MSEKTLSAVAELSAAEVAERVKMPLENWEGQCYAVAVALVESGLLPPGSRAVYGHWRGEIADASPFASRSHLGFTGHGWCLTPQEQVVDPTRWAFEAVEPYIYLGGDPEGDSGLTCAGCGHMEDEHNAMWGGPCAGGDRAGYECGHCLFDPGTNSVRLDADAFDYDEGGNRLAWENLRPFPTAEDGQVVASDVPSAVAQVLRNHGYTGGPLTFAQAIWAANLPLALLGSTAAELYGWLDSVELGALVPIDNRMKVLGGSPVAA